MSVSVFYNKIHFSYLLILILQSNWQPLFNIHNLGKFTYFPLLDLRDVEIETLKKEVENIKEHLSELSSAESTPDGKY